MSKALQPASRIYVATLFALLCVLVGVTVYLVDIRPTDSRLSQIEGRLTIVQHRVIEVPCLHADVACRRFLALLIVNANRRQLRRLVAEGHRLRHNPTPLILRTARRVRPRRVRMPPRVITVPTLGPRRTAPARAPHRAREVTPGNGNGHGQGLRRAVAPRAVARH